MDLTAVFEETYASIATPVPGRKPGDLGYWTASVDALVAGVQARLIAAGWADDEQTRQAAQYIVDNPDYANDVLH